MNNKKISNCQAFLDTPPPIFDDWTPTDEDAARAKAWQAESLQAGLHLFLHGSQTGTKSEPQPAVRKNISELTPVVRRNFERDKSASIAQTAAAEAPTPAQEKILAQCKAASEAKTAETEKILAEANKPRFIFKSLEEIAKQPEPGWTLHGFLPDRGIVCGYGSPASGKSFLFFDMCAHIALGKSWFNHKCYRQKPVYMLSLEGSAGLPRRIKAWKKIHGQLPDNMFVLSGQNFNLATDDVEFLAQGIKKGAVILIDTLNRAMLGLDENSSQGMGTAIQNLSRLQELTDSLVIVVHHCGKDASRGARGHSSLLGAVDQAMFVDKCKNDQNLRCLEVTKSKDGAENIKKYFRLDVTEVGMDDYGEAITSCVIAEADAPEDEIFTKQPRIPRNQQLALDVLAEAKTEFGKWTEYGFCISKTDFMRVYTRRSPLDKPSSVDRSGRRAMECLCGIKMIKIDGGLLVCLDDVGGQADKRTKLADKTCGQNHI